MLGFLVLSYWIDQAYEKSRKPLRELRQPMTWSTRLKGKCTMGKCDFIAIFEVPKENNVVTILLCIGNKGKIRTTTMKAWPESDTAKLLAAANLSFQL